MPELPEVETIIKGLSPLKGKTVETFLLHKDGWRKPAPIENLKKLKGKKIIGLKRRGKWPGIIFEDGVLWLHLGMSGQIRLFNNKEEATPLDRHEHFELFFKDGSFIRFKDARRFGVLAWTEGKNSEPPTQKPLGFEPFDEKWDVQQFYKDLQKSKKSIKEDIMNGLIVVGVGNIYACESLFLSKINPLRISNNLTFKESSLLRDNIILVLNEGIKNGGSTLKDYRNINGEIGGYQENHKVYGKNGEKCLICNNIIKKITQSSRTTFYCDFCQK